MHILEEKLGYTFQDKLLLQQALTHSSYSSDLNVNYERLEFLGDRILGVTIAEMLYDSFPDEREGNLAQRFVQLVCKGAVAEVMSSLSVNKYVIAGASDARRAPGVLCDVGEAIIAAIYKDSGDLSVAQDFVRRNWGPYIVAGSHPRQDFKTYLQELSVRLNLPLPEYQVIKQEGPAHEPLFTVSVTMGEGRYREGQGLSKKKAEQNAASKMLVELGVLNG